MLLFTRRCIKLRYLKDSNAAAHSVDSDILLNFRKFKVALNPTYGIFLNVAKSCVLSCLSNVDNMKNFTVPFLHYKPLKL